MCTKWEVQIFYVSTIIMHSLNIKEWKMLELGLTPKWENIHEMYTK